MDNGVGQYRAWGDVFEPPIDTTGYDGDTTAYDGDTNAYDGDRTAYDGDTNVDESDEKVAAGRTITDTKSQRILIVDDDEGSAEMLAELLKTWGHPVEIAGEVRSAIDAALTFAPQIILLDIDLPWVDGYEIARLLRGDSAFGAVRIIALTGHQGDDYKFRSLKAGFDFHMTKPIDLPLLRSVIEGGM